MNAVTRKHEASRRQLVHLAAGELGPIASWWLRRQIAADANLAQEWEEVRQLWSGLGQLRDPVAPARLPEWPRSELRAVAAARSPRRAVLAVGVTALLAVTGAVASRFWSDWISQTSFTDARGRVWRLSGSYQGKTEVLDETGRVTGEWSTDEGNPQGTRIVQVEGIRRELRELGRHEVRDGAGRLLGYVKLSGISDAERQQLDLLREWDAFVWEALYLGERDAVLGMGNPAALPGLVSGHHAEGGVSWVVRGYVRVTATYSGVEGAAEQRATSLRREALEPANAAPRYRPHLERMLSSLPRQDAEPEVRWALAAEPAVLTYGAPPGKGSQPQRLNACQWLHVRKRGTAKGYGKHEVRDEDGKTVLVLEVAPL